MQSGFFIPAATMVIDSKITHKHHVLQCFVRAAVYLPETPNFALCPLYALILSGPLKPAATHRRRTVFYGIRPSRSVRPPDLRRPSERSGAHSSFPLYTPGIVLRFGIRYLLSPTIKRVWRRVFILPAKGRQGCVFVDENCAFPAGRRKIPLV